MKFVEEVVSFEFAGIPLVGCSATGSVIGLNDQGAAVCSRMFVEDVPERDVEAVDPALLVQLKKGGFFTEHVEDRRVLSAYLHVTQRCNLQCAGCYSLDAQRNALKDASLQEICHALDELTSAGLAQLVISGGEPFMRQDLPEIVKYAKTDCGIKSVTVLSNGLCMSQDSLDALSAYVDCVSVSFDGCSADSYAYIRGEQRFEELVSAVRMVKDAGINAHIIPTVHARNIHDLQDYVKLSKDLGVSLNFSLLTCEPTDEVLGGLLPGPQELKFLGEALLKLGEGKPLPTMDTPVSTNISVRNGCGAGFRSLSVGADGSIYPCHMFHDEDFIMGNAFTGSVEDALKSDISETFRGLSVENFSDCKDCRYMRICGGGCRARSFFESGKLDAKDSYCLMTQSFYDVLGAAMSESLKQRR